MTQEDKHVSVRELLKSIDDQCAKLAEILTSFETLMHGSEYMRENRVYAGQRYWLASSASV